MSLIPGSGRFPGVGNGNPLQYSFFFFSVIEQLHILFYLFIFFVLQFYFIFKLYIIVLVLPNIKMNPPQVYMCSPSWTLLPPHSIPLGPIIQSEVSQKEKHFSILAWKIPWTKEPGRLQSMRSQRVTKHTCRLNRWMCGIMSASSHTSTQDDVTHITRWWNRKALLPSLFSEEF